MVSLAELRFCEAIVVHGAAVPRRVAWPRCAFAREDILAVVSCLAPHLGGGARRRSGTQVRDL
eukprot:3917221-Lingulodinium_polyedra.AAC.1